MLLESPPELGETISGNMTAILTYLPMLAGGAAMALMMTGGGRSTLMMVAGGLYGVSMFGMMLGQVGRGSGEKKRKINGERRDYARYLSQTRKQVRKAAEQQHEALVWRSPEPSALLGIALSSRLWERRPADDDFASIRLGSGTQRLAVTLVPPQTKPVDDLEPLSASALRRFMRTHSTVEDLPVVVTLHAFGRIHLRGDDDRARDLVRALLAHLAVFHSPDDLRIALCTVPQRLPEWDWLKWLPHAHHPSERDGIGPVRLWTDSLSKMEDLLEDLSQRPRFTGRTGATLPHYVIVLDSLPPQTDSSLANTEVDGVTLIDLGMAIPGEATVSGLTLQLTPDSMTRLTRDRMGNPLSHDLGRPDRLGLSEAESLARLLAPLRTDTGTESEDALSMSLGLLSLLGLGDATRIDTATTWRSRPPRDRLRVPIGLGPSGAPVDLDIKEAAQGGSGPHGLVVGATGSGKSELLRTLVLGLAVTHSPEVLNFVLVDFKGGATFARLEEVPHTSAVITNLADDLTMVDRMRDAIEGEMNRRQELLRDAGNYANLKDYERDREGGAPLAPIPSLFIVVDEFSELLTAKPDFIDLFIMIGRIGRSLGVHLLLASQRLEEGRLRGLDTYLSYRVGLRTFSALESRVVLGVTDAYELPSDPGHGYLKVDTTAMSRFKAAYVSGPYTGPKVAEEAGPRHTVHHVLPYTLGFQVSETPLEPQFPLQSEDSEGKETVLEVVVDRLKSRGSAARQVWLPPLKEPATLDQLLPALGQDQARGLCPVGWPGLGQLQIPIGLVDKPYYQRRDPLWLNLSGAAGHVVVVGGPYAGKSTVARDIITSLSLTHTPEQAQFYCLDFGGGTLGSLIGLPHVGSVATRLTPDLMRRTMAEIKALVNHREKVFAAEHIDSMATYRRFKAEGKAPDDPYGDVFLVVDGWGTVRSDFDALESEITGIAARGLSFGVHVVITAQRWMELRPALRDLIGTKVELRLGDPTESVIDRKMAVNVPASAPGRGLSPDNLHLLSALPRIDSDPDPESLVDGVADLVSRVSAAWTGRLAPAVRLLPEQLAYSDLPRPARGAHAAGSGTVPSLPIGIDEDALAPVFWDFGSDPHFTVFGEPRCGKTNLLRVIGRQVTDRYTEEEAKLVILDYRHNLLDLAAMPHTLAHGFTSKNADEIMQSVAQGLTKRLPPADITAEQLRARDWWHGPELFILVDDYELVATASNPLVRILDLIPLARDIGIHVVVARSIGGAARSMYEPAMQKMRESGTPGLLMSGSKDEGALLGNVKAEPMPPGRGRLVSRQGTRLIRTALITDVEDGH
jgi:S-DNA-T family DNA segregation ATPase FtsK/SpoIIIE